MNNDEQLKARWINVSNSLAVILQEVFPLAPLPLLPQAGNSFTYDQIIAYGKLSMLSVLEHLERELSKKAAK